MTAMRSLCDRVLWLEHGRLRMEGPAQQVVNAYLSNYSVDRNAVAWEDAATAPGNELARLHYVRVRSASGGELFLWEEGIDVEIGLENLAADENDLNLNVQVLNADEQVLFTTNLHENLPDAKLVPGTHHLRLTIPGRLLSPGTFYLNVRVPYRSKAQVRVDRVVNFSIPEPSRSGAWHGRRAGLFRLPLPWAHRAPSSDMNEGG
jgi:hypothetical protein